MVTLENLLVPMCDLLVNLYKFVFKKMFQNNLESVFVYIKPKSNFALYLT